MSYNVRDLLGHFVKPRSERGHMCKHACCRGKRVHPENMPVILPSKLLRRASDEDLAAHYERVQGDSPKQARARAQVLHEMQRRDDAQVAREGRAAAKFSKSLEQADAQESSYVAAEEATRGNMVNRKGQSRGVNPRTLITGRAQDFERYASDELKEFYSTRHRPTPASFRGADTRYVPRATEPKRRRRGVVTHSQLVRRLAVFRQSVLLDFVTWVAFYVIFKAIMHFVNLEARRNGWSTSAGVAGLLA